MQVLKYSENLEVMWMEKVSVETQWQMRESEIDELLTFDTFSAKLLAIQ